MTHQSRDITRWFKLNGDNWQARFDESLKLCAAFSVRDTRQQMEPAHSCELRGGSKFSFLHCARKTG